MYTYVCICMYMCIYMCVCICVYMCVCVCVCVYVCMVTTITTAYSVACAANSVFIRGHHEDERLLQGHERTSPPIKISDSVSHQSDDWLEE